MSISQSFRLSAGEVTYVDSPSSVRYGVSAHCVWRCSRAHGCRQSARGLLGFGNLLDASLAEQVMGFSGPRGSL